MPEKQKSVGHFSLSVYPLLCCSSDFFANVEDTIECCLQHTVVCKFGTGLSKSMVDREKIDAQHEMIKEAQLLMIMVAAMEFELKVHSGGTAWWY